MLLCIHGAGFTGAVFDPMLAAFPGLVAPDLPGHGDSAASQGTSVESFADAVVAEVARTALHDVVLCGHSLGGVVALEIALRRPEWLRACVILGGGAHLAVSPAILEGLERDFDATVSRVASYMWLERTPERLAYVERCMRNVGAEQVLADFRACDAYDASGRLGGIDVPLLALTGERDKMTPPAQARELADRVRHGRARILSGAGHMLMHEVPADTNEAVRSFVEEIGIAV